MSRLDEIRARLEAAKLGPMDVGHDGLVVDAAGVPVLRVAGMSALKDPDETTARAALIANAPADLAYLLGEVERLTGKEAATASREKVLRDACEQIRKRCEQCHKGNLDEADVGAVAMAVIAELCAGELL